jgi:hypothetical protein
MVSIVTVTFFLLSFLPVVPRFSHSSAEHDLLESGLL